MRRFVVTTFLLSLLITPGFTFAQTADPSVWDLDEDGFTPANGDCNDQDPLINPRATDIPGDGIDQNCDGKDAVLITDYDQDGYTTSKGDCNDRDRLIYPGAYDLAGDGIDQNCDGKDETLIDVLDYDVDGYKVMNECNDHDPMIHPGAPDTLGDAIDQNCDGVDGMKVPDPVVDPIPEPTPTPTPTPTPSPTPKPIPEPEPVDTLVPFNFGAGPAALQKDNTLVIHWATTQDSTGSVEYGIDPTDMTHTLSSPGVSQEHAVTIDAFEKGKTYYYRVMSISADGKEKISSEVLQFGVEDREPPSGTFTVQNGAAILHDRTATITFVVTDPESSRIWYRLWEGTAGGMTLIPLSYAANANEWHELSGPVRWTFEGSATHRTVYAQFKDDFNNTSPVISQAVYLAAAPLEQAKQAAIVIGASILAFFTLFNWANFLDALNDLKELKKEKDSVES